MGRFSTFILVALTAVLLVGTPLAAASRPVLLTAVPRSGHIVVTYSLEGLTPGGLIAATSPQVDAFGRLTTGVKLRENLNPSTTSGVVRMRSRESLGRGRYFVQVSGIDTDGITDCMPKLHQPCGQHWSNVRRVFVAGTAR